MKRVLLVGSALLLAFCVLLASCGKGDTFTIVVKTADNMPWHGTYIVTSATGSVEEYPIEHVGPYRLTAEGKSVVVRFTRGDIDGAFTVEILKNGASVGNCTTLTRNEEVTVTGQ